MDLGIARLEGRRLEGIATEGRLPELVLGLSGKLWVRTFSTVEGQPQWVVFLPDGSWISVGAGTLQRNTQNVRSRRRPNNALKLPKRAGPGTLS